jgi:hypothetical protein
MVLEWLGSPVRAVHPAARVLLGAPLTPVTAVAHWQAVADGEPPPLPRPARGGAQQPGSPRAAASRRAEPQAPAGARTDRDTHAADRRQQTASAREAAERAGASRNKSAAKATAGGQAGAEDAAAGGTRGLDCLGAGSGGQAYGEGGQSNRRVPAVGGRPPPGERESEYAMSGLRGPGRRGFCLSVDDDAGAGARAADGGARKVAAGGAPGPWQGRPPADELDGSRRAAAGSMDVDRARAAGRLLSDGRGGKRQQDVPDAEAARPAAQEPCHYCGSKRHAAADCRQAAPALACDC